MTEYVFCGGCEVSSSILLVFFTPICGRYSSRYKIQFKKLGIS